MTGDFWSKSVSLKFHHQQLTLCLGVLNTFWVVKMIFDFQIIFLGGKKAGSQNKLLWRVSLLYLVRELAGEGSVDMAVAVGDR